jgi:hypothetical protein
MRIKESIMRSMRSILKPGGLLKRNWKETKGLKRTWMLMLKPIWKMRRKSKLKG